MKRMALIAVVLCAMLVATVGAGVVTAKYGPNQGKGLNGAGRTACTSRGRGRGVGWSAGRGRGRGVGAGVMTASFTATFQYYRPDQKYAVWTIDASSSTGPINQYWLDYYWTDIARNPQHGHSGASVPDLAIQLNNINQGTPVTATLTVYDASGNHVTSPQQTLPWS